VTTFQGPPLETELGIGALTLPALLTDVTARHADREAIAFHEPDGTVRRLTYTELEHETRTFAKALLASGVDQGTRVALLMGNRPEWVIAALGAARIGAVIVAINTYLAVPELEYVLAHSDAELLVMQPRLANRSYVDELRGHSFPRLKRTVVLGDGWDAFLEAAADATDAAVAERAAAIVPEHHALVIYTSGTTALPKGILHAHRGPAIQSWRFATHLRLDPTVRVWSAFPFFWSAGFVMVMGATLVAGGCLVLQEHFDAGEALRLLEAERVTSPHAWVHQLAELEDHPDWPSRDLSAVRHCEAYASFGRHPSVHVDDVWSPRSAYGLSETCTIVSSLAADTPVELRDSCQGAILPGNAFRVLDPVTGAPLPAGEIGELAVKGPTLMEHYVKVPPEECFDTDGFFHTGDAGFVDEENYLHWTGRTSDMIKTGGANVSPVEVELALLRHPLLKAALAVGVPDPRYGELVVVCAVPHESTVVTEDDVREFLRGKIASYKIPRRVLFFAETELSFTGSNKIRTSELRALATERLAAS
jgi:fatty-acyl-CoA synthase